MASGGLITDFISYGSGAPSGAPDVVSGEYAFYQDTDDGTMYVWNLSGTPAWDPLASGGGGGSGIGDYLCYCNEQSSGTGGGTCTSGSWGTLTLNTEVADSGNHGSLSSNQITLLAGTYRYRFAVPFIITGQSKARLYNTSDTAIIGKNGSAAFARVDVGVGAVSIGFGRFTIASTKVLELQYRVTTTRSTDGQGTPASFSGEAEIYAQIEFWREP